MNLDNLPNDLLKVTLLTEDLKTIKEHCKSSSKAQAIYQDDFFWQQLVQRDFNNYQQKLCRTWHDTYKILNKPVYEILFITMHGYEEPDIDSEIFWDYEIALNNLIDIICDSYCHCDCLDQVVITDLSPKFQQLVENSCLEDLEHQSIENPELTSNYQTYIQRYKNLLKDKLETEARVGCVDPHFEFCIMKKSVK